tara:strand:+ start:42649 stop:42960 length:312 start_codon:yes stop_codon:yes gene_type:complete
MMPLPNVFCYFHHRINNNIYPDPQDDNSGLRQERRDLMPFFNSFNTISATFYAHYPEILNFFDNRSTNASAESFNAKLKAFRATQRGVVNIEFFLFRVAKIYA